MLRLGLDLGTNSIGWALYRLDGDREPEALLDGGVLIHADGRDPQSRASNAAQRREKRGPRRNRDRTLRRQRRLAHLLHDLDLLPEGMAERAAARNRDPLELRAAALDRALTPHELGRALAAFADRRGFRSNRKTDTGEDGAIRKDTGELRRRIGQSGARTLGEYLWGRRRRGKTIRARLGNGLYPDRAMVEAELRAIRAAQAGRHPDVAAEDWDAIIDTILFQRPLRPVEVGQCTLLPGEKRAYKAYPLFQRFRIWQEVSNLEFAPPGEGYRPLDRDQRECVAAKLASVRSQSFERIASVAGLPAGSRVNLETTARAGLDGDLTAAALGNRKRFGKRWAALAIERQQEVVERLLDEEDSEEVERWLRDEFGLDADAARETASATLPPGTGHLSRAAIERLLPFMRDEGLPYDKAVAAAPGLGHHSDLRGDGKAERLPYYGAVLERDVLGGREDGRTDVERYGRIPNPTVHIALGQLRRLFNAIADRHGKPDQVVVELARDLKQSRKDRERDQRAIRDNRQRNERLRALAEDAGRPDPSPHDMRKLRLWDEQGPPDARLCPFSGEALSVGRVLSEETEVEHILPFSRSLDDSMANTVLSMRAANREKGQRTPHEAWGSDPARYRAILERADRLPPNKRWRFREDAMAKLEEQGGFLGRQLNDTRHLSRATSRYLQAAVHPDAIWVTPGRLTAMLRRAWGLNSLLADGGGKNRDDHRHHLIDAAVVGMTSRSLLQRVAHESASAVDDLGGRVTDAVDDPWEGFRDDVKALVGGCVVRHRPDHFRPRHGTTTGQLHNETAYGVVAGPDARGMMTLVETKPLDELDAKRLDDVRDLTLRDRLRELHAAVVADGGDQAAFAGRALERYGVRRVRVLTQLGEDSLAFITDAKTGAVKAYKTDGNAYMDVWMLPGGRTTGETVSRFNAHKPDYRSKVKGEHPRARKLMRLHINDMVAIGEGDERRILRVQFLSGQGITAVDHNEGGNLHQRVRDKKLDNYYVPLRVSASRVLSVGLRKVSVDVIGRVRDGGPLDHEGRGKRG